ncbi:MAG TPA: hypothetical protein VNO74_07225 [Methylomirabilota bacterium]|nr:hypothetical protein [Methylomirabilota bacterium]
MEQSQAALVEHLKRLERKQAELQRTNRRLGSVIGAIILVTGALVLMGQTSQPQTLEATEFVLRGSDGKVRGAMGVLPDGAMRLNLTDVKGQTRITLDVEPDGSPGLDFYDPQGKLRATLALSSIGTPGFGLYDETGKLRTSLDVPAVNTPGLAFYKQDGKPAWGAP